MAIKDFLPEEFGGTLDPGSAEDQETDDLFNFLPDVRVPSQQELQNPNMQFATDPVSPRVGRAARGARTEVRRGLNRLPEEGRALFAEELEEEQGGWSMLNGVMETLNADVAAPAVFIDEMLNDSGNFNKAMNRASKVFAGGLPGVSAEEAMYSHGDWMRDTGWFDTEDGTHWSLPVLGFIADIVASPVNILTLGSGTAMKTAATGAVGISKARRAAQIAVNPTLGLAAEAAGAMKRAGGTARLTDAAAVAGVPGAKTFGELFLPNFEKIQETERIARRRISAGDMEGAVRVRADANQFIQLSREMISDREEGYLKASNVVRELMHQLPSEQRIMFQMFMDQDMKRLESHLRTYYREIAPDGVVDEEMIQGAIKRAKDIKLEHDKIRYAQKEAGIQLDPWELAKHGGHHAPLVFPTTGESLKWAQKVVKNNKQLTDMLDEMDVNIEPMKEARGVEALRKFKDPAEAAAAGIPFEMDIGKSTFKHAIQANAKINTRRMLDTWLKNPEIARPLAINSDVAMRSSGRVTDDVSMLMDPEYRKTYEDMGYTLFDPQRLREIDLGSDEFGAVIDNFRKYGDHNSQLYWIPKAFSDDLIMSRRLYDDSNSLHRLMGKVSSVQSLWKSYALLSPGYHMRNLHSNLFMNFIAGVQDPRTYMEAMAVQAGGTDKLPMIARQIVEKTIGKKTGKDVLFTDKNGKMWTVDNLHETANSRAVMTSGLFDQDLPRELEQTLLTGIDNVAKVSMNRHTFTRGAAKLQQDAMDAGAGEDEARLGASIMNARARHSSLAHGGDPEEWWHNKHVQEMPPDGPDMWVTLPQSEGGGTEIFRHADMEAGELEGHIYGELENVLHKTFSSGRIPSADTLKNRIVNGRDFRLSGRDGNKIWNDIYPEGAVPVDPKRIMRRAQEVLYRDENFGDWYKDFGENMASIVGRENMPEFANVFAILSGRKLTEQNLAEAAFVMRRVRQGMRSGDKWGQENFMKWMNSEPMIVRNAKGGMGPEEVPTQIMGKEAGVGQMKRLFDFYDSAREDFGVGVLKGGTKTTNFAFDVMHRSRSDFFPFVVNDTIMASVFGFRTGKGFGFADRGNHAQYRYAQHIVAQIAKHLGRSPDDVMAALWFDGKARGYMMRAAEGGEIDMVDSAAAVLGRGWPHANVEMWRQGDFLASEIGTWKSAKEFSDVELNRLSEEVHNFPSDAPLIEGFTFEEQIKSAKGSAERSDVMAAYSEAAHGGLSETRWADSAYGGIPRVGGRPGANVLYQEDVAREQPGLINLSSSDENFEMNAMDLADTMRGVNDGLANNINEAIRTVRDDSEIIPRSGIIIHPGSEEAARAITKQVTEKNPNFRWGRPASGGAVQWRIASETVRGLEEVFEADIVVSPGDKDKPYFRDLSRAAVDLFMRERKANPELRAELTVINDKLREKLENLFGFVKKSDRSERVIVPSDKTFEMYERRGRLFQDGIAEGRYIDAADTNAAESLDEFKNELAESTAIYVSKQDARTQEFWENRGGYPERPFIRTFLEKMERFIDEGGIDAGHNPQGIVYATDGSGGMGAAHWTMKPAGGSDRTMSGRYRLPRFDGDADGSTASKFSVDIFADRHSDTRVFRNIVNGVTDKFSELKESDPTLVPEVYVVNPKLAKVLRRLGFTDAPGYASTNTPGSERLTATDAVFERVRRKGGDLLQREHDRVIRGGIDIRDSDGNILDLYDSDGRSVRDAIRTPLQESQYVISLHRDNQNASTLIHEMGHLFRLEGDMGRADMKALSDFVGDDASKRVMDRGAEEKFARAFESYVMEGSSPVRGMEDVFSDMAAKLENVYQTVPPEEITPEIRAVMDRLFKRVNEHEIAAAAINTVGDSRNTIMPDAVNAGANVLKKWFGRDSPLVRGNHMFGRAMENNSRAALFLDRIKKGESDVNAANSVFKYLLDYDEITDFEKRWLRNVIPFYTWMRKSAPLQVQAVLEDPARYSVAPKFMNFVEAYSEDWEHVEGPDYFSETNAVRLPILYNEKPLFLVPDLPFQEFNTLSDPAGKIASGLTPFIKAPFEWYPKHAQSLFTDRPIEKYIGEPGEGVLGQLFGASKKFENLARTAVPTFGKIDRAVTDTQKGEGFKRLSSEGLGLRVVPIDEQKIARSKAFQQQDVLRRVKKRLRDEGVISGEPIKPVSVSKEGSRRRKRRRRRDSR